MYVPNLHDVCSEKMWYWIKWLNSSAIIISSLYSLTTWTDGLHFVVIPGCIPHPSSSTSWIVVLFNAGNHKKLRCCSVSTLFLEQCAWISKQAGNICPTGANFRDTHWCRGYCLYTQKFHLQIFTDFSKNRQITFDHFLVGFSIRTKCREYTLKNKITESTKTGKVMADLP